MESFVSIGTMYLNEAVRKKFEFSAIEKFLKFYLAYLNSVSVILPPMPELFALLNGLTGWADVELIKTVFGAMLKRKPECFDAEIARREIVKFIVGWRAEDEEFENKAGVLLTIATEVPEKFKLVCTQEVFDAVKTLGAGSAGFMGDLFDMVLVGYA
jgi:hypothetical protein